MPQQQQQPYSQPVPPPTAQIPSPNAYNPNVSTIPPTYTTATLAPESAPGQVPGVPQPQQPQEQQQPKVYTPIDYQHPYYQEAPSATTSPQFQLPPISNPNAQATPSAAASPYGQPPQSQQTSSAPTPPTRALPTPPSRPPTQSYGSSSSLVAETEPSHSTGENKKPEAPSANKFKEDIKEPTFASKITDFDINKFGPPPPKPFKTKDEQEKEEEIKNLNREWQI